MTAFRFRVAFTASQKWWVGPVSLENASELLPSSTINPVVGTECETGPARIFGLDRPRIAVGAPANLVLLDLNARWRVREDRFRSRSANSWLLGERLTGRVVLTVAAGQVAFDG